MKLYAFRVFVKDWATACHFYEHTLGLPLRFKDESLGWADFDVGGPCLGVERVDADDADAAALVGRFLGVSLQVDNIYATYDRLKANGVVFEGPPEGQLWGGVLVHLRDPEDNVLTLLG